MELELGLDLRLGLGSGSASLVYIESLCNALKVFSEVSIEGSLRCIYKPFEVLREDLQKSIVIRRGFKRV